MVVKRLDEPGDWIYGEEESVRGSAIARDPIRLGGRDVGDDGDTVRAGEYSHRAQPERNPADLVKDAIRARIFRHLGKLSYEQLRDLNIAIERLARDNG